MYEKNQSKDEILPQIKTGKKKKKKGISTSELSGISEIKTKGQSLG